jgi:hypothetical protein
MKRPNKIRIFGKPHELVFVPQDIEHGILGQYSYKSHVLHIKQGQPPAEELDTVIHEVLHAITNVMTVDFGDEDMEEMVVRKFGTGITGVLLDNPEFLQYISTMAKQVNK